VLDHVLTEHEVKRVVLEGQPPGGVEIAYRCGQRHEVRIEPSGEDIETATDMESPGGVRTEVFMLDLPAGAWNTKREQPELLWLRSGPVFDVQYRKQLPDECAHFGTPQVWRLTEIPHEGQKRELLRPPLDGKR
jgi:hypothetical protein